MAGLALFCFASAAKTSHNINDRNLSVCPRPWSRHQISTYSARSPRPRSRPPTTRRSTHILTGRRRGEWHSPMLMRKGEYHSPLQTNRQTTAGGHRNSFRCCARRTSSCAASVRTLGFPGEPVLLQESSGRSRFLLLCISSKDLPQHYELGACDSPGGKDPPWNGKALAARIGHPKSTLVVPPAPEPSGIIKPSHYHPFEISVCLPVRLADIGRVARECVRLRADIFFRVVDRHRGFGCCHRDEIQLTRLADHVTARK